MSIMKNTDKELWREKEGDYYSDSIHVTENGGLGINCGGYVVVKPVRDWHKLSQAPAPLPDNKEGGELVKRLHKWMQLDTNKATPPYCLIMDCYQALTSQPPAISDDVVEEWVTLSKCPEGLFKNKNGHIGFKTEYSTPIKVGLYTHHYPQAFVVESGEYWWGGYSKHKERAEQLVCHVSIAALQKAQSGKGEA